MGAKPSSTTMSALHRRITGELADLLANPSPGITAEPNADDITTWTATISGPEHSPYAGGRFKLTIHFPPTYPFNPPVVRFITKVYHPNINPDTGSIGLKALDDEWTAIVTTAAVLLSVQAFLAAPVLSQNPRNALMPDIAQEFQMDREEYVKTAEEWTVKYAMETLDPQPVSAGSGARPLGQM
ncbi:unnamed protein product [Zymoseptoria tritici ST99CH_3D1]|nr:unnamed protein product [Zymoseptoria tritici ST99CH_3D1]